MSGKSHRPKRVELSREETLQRMKDLPKRAPAIIAAIRGAAKMTKKKSSKKRDNGTPEREKLTLEESLTRVLDLPKRKEKIIAAIRKGTD